MSVLDPPPFSQRKRKRPLPATDEINASQFSSQPPPNSINPLSHTPGTIHQFSVAGLSETDPNPSEQVPDFPHRSPGRSSSRNVEPDSDVDDSELHDKKAVRKKASEPGRGGHFDVLLQSVHQFIDQGDIEKASRAYGLLLQLRPLGVLIDIRHHNLWAIGAEILMREGEEPDPNRETKEGLEDPRTARPKRWGREENMNKVKAYFETLIQQHPYDYRHPRVVSALDFWLAMLSCEIYNAHTEHMMALNRLDDGACDWDEEEPSYGYLGSDGGFKGDESEQREIRMKQRREQLRQQALATMQEITRRMDMLMQDPPYSKSPYYLRLRAMASLYVADLVIPIADTLPRNMEEAQKRRRMEQETARAALQRIVDGGGQLDQAALAVLDLQDEDESDLAIPLYSSLPIRGL
ncbi:Fc.00g086360.m01.CDS01 [Cosmosporella sp. VM-42]